MPSEKLRYIQPHPNREYVYSFADSGEDGNDLLCITKDGKSLTFRISQEFSGSLEIAIPMAELETVLDALQRLQANFST